MQRQFHWDFTKTLQGLLSKKQSFRKCNLIVEWICSDCFLPMADLYDYITCKSQEAIPWDNSYWNREIEASGYTLKDIVVHVWRSFDGKMSQYFISRSVTLCDVHNTLNLLMFELISAKYNQSIIFITKAKSKYGEQTNCLHNNTYIFLKILHEDRRTVQMHCITLSGTYSADWSFPKQ